MSGPYQDIEAKVKGYDLKIIMHKGVKLVLVPNNLWPELRLSATEIDFDADQWLFCIKDLLLLQGIKITKWQRKRLLNIRLSFMARRICDNKQFAREICDGLNIDFDITDEGFWEDLENLGVVNTTKNNFMHPARTSYRLVPELLVGGEVFLLMPYAVLQVLSSPTEEIPPDQVLYLLRCLRLEILKSERYNDYFTFLDYIQDSQRTEPEGWQSVLSPYEFDAAEIDNYILAAHHYVYEFANQSPQLFRELILTGQFETWVTLGTTYKELKRIQNFIEATRTTFFCSSYSRAVEQVRQVLACLSEAFAELTKFERRMGIDRHLSYRLAHEDLQLVYSQVSLIKGLANKQLKEYKDLFQDKYHLGNVSATVESMFFGQGDSPVTREMPPDQQRVFLFIIDGYGYTQHLWYRNVCWEKAFSFTDNIFNWLSDNGFLFEGILGAPLITDTGAGLSTIYTGQLPSSTGVICSRVFYREKVQQVKQLEYDRFEEMIGDIPESFLERVGRRSVAVNSFYCSTLRNEWSGFTSMCFGNTQVQQEPIAERVFNRVIEGVSETGQQLQVVYYPKLDSTGHPTGAFTPFEIYEHEKLNFLFVNFLVNLAIERPEIFDGLSSILITADHGMAETAGKAIRREDFSSLCPELVPHLRYVVENNRSLLFYGVLPERTAEAAEAIKNVFAEKGMHVSVLDKNNPLIGKLLDGGRGTYSHRLCPDIVALLEGEGVVFTRELHPFSYHYGGHGGRSCEEVFVPLIRITLTQELLNAVKQRYLKLI